jgi:membrane fusion protein (multidrug efflux system)
MKRAKIISILIAAAMCAALMEAQAIEFAAVVSKPISRAADLPGEFLPFMSVSLHAKVPGYVERVIVDRGSRVESGQLLVELSAPEMGARIAEAESKVQSIEADKLQAEAQQSAAQATYDRLKKAAETPGAIAGNEVIQAEKQVEAVKALVRSREQAIRAAEAAVKTEQQLQSYLRITAPFNGIVTERLVHPGALVGPGADPVLLVIQQISQLRLVVAVPEEYVGGIAEGGKVAFQVAAYPERSYTGTIARISHSLNNETRTMPVELDVTNRDGSLAPGMYPTVKWPVRRARPALFVPKTSVVSTTERVFVIRNKNGRAEWVDVRKGSADGDLVEVLGDLKAGDMVVRRADDEIREGAALKAASSGK